jgi:hypothetical protein
MSGLSSGLRTAALAYALLLPVYFLVASLGVKFGLLDWRIGLGVMIIQFGAIVLMVGVALALAALVATLLRKPRRGWLLCLVALLVPVLGLVYANQVRQQASRVPPIHDVTTNPSDPPQFSPAILEARTASGANRVGDFTTPLSADPRYATGPVKDRALGEVIRVAYPQVRTLVIPARPDLVFPAAEAAARAEGWKIVTVSPERGALEATAETFWFGFKDDVAVRVRPAPNGGSAVDVRSTSRVGLSDLGTNAKRIEGYLADVQLRSSGG